jgi:cytochrome c oxidase subunit 3
MLISFFVLVVFAQWAVYAARRRDRAHIGISLGLVGLIAIAIVNAQAYVYNQMALPAADSIYASMFYAVTGTMTALVIAGLVFTVVTAFRLLGGRETDQEIVAAHALYWYVLTVAFSALWLIVYVSK